MFSRMCPKLSQEIPNRFMDGGPTIYITVLSKRLYFLHLKPSIQQISSVMKIPYNFPRNKVCTYLVLSALCPLLCSNENTKSNNLLLSKKQNYFDMHSRGQSLLAYVCEHFVHTVPIKKCFFSTVICRLYSLTARLVR